MCGLFYDTLLKDDTLFAGATASDPDGLTAFDASSGERRWRAGNPGDIWHLVVTTDTAFVGYFSDSVDLAAYDVDSGTRRWARTHPGVHTHPAVSDGSLYATTGSVVRYQRRSALDSLVGSAPGTAWQSDLSVIPRAPTVSDELVIYGGRSDSGAPVIRGVDRTTGNPAWTAFQSGKGTLKALTPALGRDRGFTGLTYRRTENPRYAVGALSLSDGSVSWTRQIDQQVTDTVATGTAVAVATTTASGDDSSTLGTVRALDPSDGTENWRIRFQHPPTSLAVVDGAIFVVTETGEVIALR